MNKLDSAEYYNRLGLDIYNKYNLKGLRGRPFYIAGMIQEKKGNIQPAINLLRLGLPYDSTGDHSVNVIRPTPERVEVILIDHI